MIEDLKNKVVLITGSSTGIGAAAAKAFGANGARVAVHYNKSKSEAEKVAAEIERSGGKAFLVTGDVSGSMVCKDLVHKTVAHFGRIDVLINNAGVSDMRGVAPESFDMDTWNWIMSIDLNGGLAFSQAAASQGSAASASRLRRE